MTRIEASHEARMAIVAYRDACIRVFTHTHATSDNDAVKQLVNARHNLESMIAGLEAQVALLPPEGK